MYTRIAVLALTVCALTGGCSSDTDEPDSSTTPSAAAAPAEVKPEVAGTPTVVWYRSGGETDIDYTNAVAFELRNPSDQPIQQGRFAIDVLGPDGVMGSSGPLDVPLAPGETRLVVSKAVDIEVPGNVYDEAEVKKKAPQGAKVTTYGSPTGGPAVDPVTTWKSDNLKVTCSGGIAACAVTGDLTWTGELTVGSPRLMAAVRAKPGGPILAAGEGTTEIAQFTPGSPQPVELDIIGLDSPPANPVIELVAHLPTT
jgi:hypothetical protein